MTFELGTRASVAKCFGAAELSEYADLVGGTVSTRTVPEPLIGGMFSQLLGMRLPGQGTNWLKQKMRFLAPAYAGEELIAVVEVVRVRPEKKLVNLSTRCTTANGRVVCEGEALVLCLEMSEV